MQVNGSWSTAYNPTTFPTAYPKSYVRMSAGASSAQFTAINTIPNYNTYFALIEAYPLPGSNAALKVVNGGFRASNFSTTTSVTYSDEVVNYTKGGNDGYAIYCEGQTSTATSFYTYGAGEFTGDVTANTSDKRLKTNIKNIDSPLQKLSKINGVYFNWNDTAKELTGKDTEKREVGFIAQEVQSVLPEIIKPAPFDTIDANGGSKSGENYLTIQYEKVVPLLVECIKELQKEIEELKKNK
jgi:hypothetical protein